MQERLSEASVPPQKQRHLAAALQETGRAGRDGKVATCVMYYGYQDAVKMRHMLTESARENNTSPDQLQRNMESVNAMVSPPSLLSLLF